MMEYDSFLKRKGILIQATVWVNLEDTMLSGVIQTQKDKYYVILHTRSTYSSQTHTDRK